MNFRTASRYLVSSPEDLPVTEHANPHSKQVGLLPPGTRVVCAEIAAGAEGGPTTRIRISAPDGWISTEGLEDAPRQQPLALGWEEFDANHLEPVPGDQYGLRFPFTHAMFCEMGAEFLTRAFQASGAISANNRVERLLNYRIFDGGGASITAAFDVTYRDANESTPNGPLHTKLFVKMPAADPMRKFISSHMLFGETQIAMRFSKLAMPVPVCQYYFGDYARQTTNGILITERIPFGEPPIEPVLSKGLDHLSPDAAEHYAVLTDLQAQLVAAHKRGFLGPEAEEIFPFRSKTAGMPPVEVAPLIDFVENVVGHLLPAQFTDAGFLAQVRRDGQQILDLLDPLSRFLSLDVDYTGFCHANLNLDNAWFWREPDGQLAAGLIDWGSAGQMSLGQSFQGMLFATEPARFLALRRELVHRFVSTFETASGRRLDPETLLLHAKIASMTGLPLLVFAIKDALEHYPLKDLQAISNADDPRASQDTGLGTMLAMLGTFLSEWFDSEQPSSVCHRIQTRA